MLQFVFGLPRSGKTTKILSIAKKLANDGKNSVIIVPEQATFETEKSVLQTVGDSFALNIEVLSFTRLQDEISRKIGGISAKVLKDSDKIIFMNKALKQISGELKVWGKYANSLNFAKTMLDSIGEFKICAITTQQINNAQLLTDSQSLKDKLSDFALIFETYEMLIAERYIDPVDKLTKLYYNLENHHYFKNKTVFLDGFKGFTGQQFKIISRILSQANDVYITFTNDADSKRELDIFSNIRLAIMKIEKIANSYNVSINKPIILSDTYYTSNTIPQIERVISGNNVSVINDDTVTICKANTVYDEAEFAARTIRKLVRTQNYRYRDFAIIARDTERYATAIEHACDKNGVYCFLDKKLSMADFPLSVAVLSAIKALNFSTENILHFHKSGIGVLSVEEISLLENYTYLWNINGELWLKDWDMDTRGFITEELDENAISELEKINHIRRKAIEPLIFFKNNFSGNAEIMSKAIVELLDSCCAADSLKNMCKELSSNDIFSSDALKQAYDIFMGILDSLVTCFGKKTLKISEYYDALNLAISLEEVGIIPQTIDQVVFGQADRIRTSGTKIAFILGANQGIFPKFSDNSGIFATKERKKLIDIGLDITDNQIYDSIDENFLVYCNLFCPSDKLYISYSLQSLKGEPLSEASFVSNLKDSLNIKTVSEPAKINLENLPETEQSAFSELCRRISKPEEFNSIKTAIDFSRKDNKTNDFLSAVNLQKQKITTENAEKLYGNNIYISATKFDTFNRCKFSFFCKYGLRLKKIQPADFDVLQRGTIVHYVLEKIISVYKEDIKNFSREQLDNLCDLYIEEYLNSVVGYNSVKTARHEFLISKISRSLKEVLFHLSKEFAQSDFKPNHCELKIGGKDGIPLDFQYSKGKIIVNGSIDRVDQFNGYIRIVDYKTGTKTFKLPDILFGLNLQMLIYLYAITRGQGIEDKNAAGIFYMPSKRDLNNEGMCMNGLVKADIDLVLAMEKENSGEYVPALTFNKDGSLSKNSSNFITEDEFSKIFDYIEVLMKKTGNSIANGEIYINPVDGRESAACDYCDFKSICGREEDISFKVPIIKNSEIFEIIEKENSNGI